MARSKFVTRRKQRNSARLRGSRPQYGPSDLQNSILKRKQYQRQERHQKRIRQHVIVICNNWGNWLDTRTNTYFESIWNGRVVPASQGRSWRSLKQKLIDNPAFLILPNEEPSALQYRLKTVLQQELSILGCKRLLEELKERINNFRTRSAFFRALRERLGIKH